MLEVCGIEPWSGTDVERGLVSISEETATTLLLAGREGGGLCGATPALLLVAGECGELLLPTGFAVQVLCNGRASWWTGALSLGTVARPLSPVLPPEPPVSPKLLGPTKPGFRPADISFVRMASTSTRRSVIRCSICNSKAA
jgi:hypothetical protein